MSPFLVISEALLKKWRVWTTRSRMESIKEVAHAVKRADRDIFKKILLCQARSS
jgi:hypothetical protein